MKNLKQALRNTDFSNVVLYLDTDKDRTEFELVAEGFTIQLNIKYEVNLVDYKPATYLDPEEGEFVFHIDSVENMEVADSEGEHVQPTHDEMVDIFDIVQGLEKRKA